jgi:hypothetical protein
MANWLKRLSRAIEREPPPRIRRASDLDRQQRHIRHDEGAEIANIPRGAAANRSLSTPEPRPPMPTIAPQPAGQGSTVQEQARPEAVDDEEEGTISNIPPGKPMG